MPSGTYSLLKCPVTEFRMVWKLYIFLFSVNGKLGKWPDIECSVCIGSIQCCNNTFRRRYCSEWCIHQD